MLRSFLPLTLFLLLPYVSTAAVRTSKGNGNWTSANTWTPSAAPAAGDVLVIEEGHMVTISSNISYGGAPMQVDVHGPWRFNGGGAKITLPVNSVIHIHEGGSVVSNAPGMGGVSQTISIGSTVYWQGGPGSTVDGPMAWPNVPLPVELSAFKVEALMDVVTAWWTTASERNSSHFVLERSGDLAAWQEAGTLAAAGHSSQPRDYVLEERGVEAGLWYYRLVQKDLDGTEDMSPVIPVRVVGTRRELRCSLEGDGPAVVHVWASGHPPGDAVPRLVTPATGRAQDVRWEDHGTKGLRVTLPALGAGMYLIRLDGTDGVRTCRFVLSR